MSAPLLNTKFRMPPLRPELVLHSYLIERLNPGLYRKLALVSASGHCAVPSTMPQEQPACTAARLRKE
jgi:LuxR family maltose regulon positive regulatory protein